MPLFLHKEELLELLKNFHISTGISVTLFDNEGAGIITFPQVKNNFCEFMSKNNDFYKKCINCTAKGINKCAKSRTMEIYTCHAGLTEVVAPIIKNDIILGYLMFGQVMNNKKQDSSYFVNDLISQYNIKIDKNTNIPKIKHKTDEQILAISKILEVLTEFIILKEMMNLKTTKLFEELKKYIDDNLSKDITIDTLCAKFNISRRTLYNIMKRHTELGIASYIKLRRLESAKSMLKTTDLSIPEIAEKVGFSDYNYFLRIFKSTFGISPKKFFAQDH